MKYIVKINNKSQKNIEKMPVNVGKLMALLICDLSVKGPIQKEWNNFSRLGENKFHCHFELSLGGLLAL